MVSWLLGWLDCRRLVGLRARQLNPLVEFENFVCVCAVLFYAGLNSCRALPVVVAAAAALVVALQRLIIQPLLVKELDTVPTFRYCCCTAVCSAASVLRSLPFAASTAPAS